MRHVIGFRESQMAEPRELKKGHNILLITALCAIGWVAVVLLVFSPPDWLTPDPPPAPAHPPYEPATVEGPPVISLRHLANRGFDAATLDLIEPHFQVLNAALVTIVELKGAYDTATYQPLRQRLRSEAVYFHTTADTHEERIERLLPEDLGQRFHAYVREREAAAGLHQDTVWHRHENPEHRGVSPGFEPGITLHTWYRTKEATLAGRLTERVWDGPATTYGVVGTSLFRAMWFTSSWIDPATTSHRHPVPSSFAPQRP
jgi:hypothetical protein